MECQVSISLSGAPSGSLNNINIPSGYAIDTSKLVSSNSSNMTVEGSGTALAGGIGYPLLVRYNSITSVRPLLFSPDGTGTPTSVAQYSGVSSSQPRTWANGDSLVINFSVPISGWSSGGGTSPILSLSDWISYTPTYTGFGTVSVSNVFYRRVGDSIQIQGKFTPGTTTATEARISLPSGLTSDSAKIPAIRLVGKFTKAAAVSAGNGGQWEMYVESGVTYMTMGLFNPNFNGLTKQNANAIVGSGEVVSLFAEFPISGWTSTSSGSLTAPRSEITVDSGNGHGATANKIRRFSNIRKNVGSAITYADDANNGGTFTINETGVYSISYTDQNTTASERIGITVNDTATTTTMGTPLTYAQGARANSVTPSTFPTNVGWTGNLTAGDVVRAHTNGGADGTNATVMFTITKVSN
jgi:hypothetical protein